MEGRNLPKKVYDYGDAPGNRPIIQSVLVGQELLGRPLLNKGTAFTREERNQFSLNSLLPFQVDTIEQQITRVKEQYDAIDSNLRKNSFLQGIHDQNEVLFFRFVLEHLKDVLPVIYTPTESEYIEKYSHLFRRPRGVYINYYEKEKTQLDLIEGVLHQSVASTDIDLIVVTDSEEILGIGDQGIGGTGITVAKLMLYTVIAGVHPARVLPVVLDVGTDNQSLLDDPLYLGWRHKRVRGQEYDDFLDRFVECVHGKFPNAFLHWEDFGFRNARRLLDKYRPKMATFNDDIQGTGAITLALLLAALQLKQEKMSNQRIVIFGAGSAGIGIADQIYSYLIQKEGMSEKEALERIWCIDKYGLIMNDGDTNTTTSETQHLYVKSNQDIRHWSIQEEGHKAPQLLDVTENVKPTILIGVSTCPSAFTEPVIRTMTSSCDNPIVFPLSNPSRLSEAKPADIIHWSDGKAIVATGSPFPPVEYKGKTFEITECNNVFVYPGVGLGCIVSKAEHCTDDMLFAAANAISQCSPAIQSNEITKGLLCDLQNIRTVSKKVAVAVVKQAILSGEARIQVQSKTSNVDTDEVIEKLVSDYMWYPSYPTYRVTQRL